MRFPSVFFFATSSIFLRQKYKTSAVRQAHLSKSKKCGILPFVIDFEDFAELAEGIFRDTVRRNDLEKAYKGLTEAVFDAGECLSCLGCFGGP